jgi:hypothetical protein
MDAIAAEAIASLTTAMSSLLPSPPTPALAPALMVTPVKVAPAGIGGYVGHHPDPQGDVLGRRVTARVIMSVPAANATALDDEVERITQSVLTTGRGELAQLGILKLSLLELGPRPPAPSGGPPTAPRRDVTFDVLYEFLKFPEAAGGALQTVTLDIESAFGNEPRTLINGAFVANPLADFDTIDDPAATQASPSNWSYNAALEAVVQTSAINGGTTNSAAPDKPGSYLMLRASPTRPLVRDLSVAASLDATAPGAVGLVFRFVDVSNFYYVILDSRNGFRRIGKKVGGTFAALEQGGLDASTGFTLNTLMRVRLIAEGLQFRLVLDGETVLEAADADLTNAGRVGFFVHNCTGARFFDFTLLQL